MRTLSLPAGHTVALFQTPHELPARRHLHFNAYLVQAGGLGSTPEAINQRFARIGQLLEAGKKEDAVVEVENLHYAFYFALEQFSPAQLAFGVLVAEVDGQPVTDFSEDALRALLEQLSQWGLTAGMVQAEVEAVKKKLSAALTNLFPERGANADSHELAVASQQRRRALAVLDYLLTEEPAHLRVVEEVDRWLLELSRPDVFTDGDPANVLTHLHRSFENLCAILAQHGTPDAGSLPLFQFHARLSWLQKQLESKRGE